jgi:hypothetical protein
MPTCPNPKCELPCAGRTCRVCGTPNPAGQDVLEAAREYSDFAPVPRGLAWVAAKWPEVAWLCGLKRKARDFYRTEPHRTQLMRAYPKVAPAVWPLILDHAEN